MARQIWINRVIWDKLYGLDFAGRHPSVAGYQQNPLMYALTEQFIPIGRYTPYLTNSKLIFIGEVDDTGICTPESLVLEYRKDTRTFEVRAAISELIDESEFHKVSEHRFGAFRNATSSLLDLFHDIRARGLSANSYEAQVIVNYIHELLTPEGTTITSATSKAALMAEVLYQQVHTSISELVITANNQIVATHALGNESIRTTYKDVGGFHDAIRSGLLRDEYNDTTPLNAFETGFNTGYYTLGSDPLNTLFTITSDEEDRITRIIANAAGPNNLRNVSDIDNLIDELMPVLNTQGDEGAVKKFAWYVSIIGDKSGANVAEILSNIRDRLQERNGITPGTGTNIFKGHGISLDIPFNQAGRVIGNVGSMDTDITMMNFARLNEVGGAKYFDIKNYGKFTNQSLRSIVHSARDLGQHGVGTAIDTEAIISDQLNYLLTGNKESKFLTEIGFADGTSMIRQLSERQSTALQYHYNTALDDIGKMFRNETRKLSSEELTQSVSDIFQYVSGFSNQYAGMGNIANKNISDMTMTELQAFIVSQGRADKATIEMAYQFQTSNPQEQMAYIRGFLESVSPDNQDVQRVIDRTKSIIQTTAQNMQTTGYSSTQMMLEIGNRLGSNDSFIEGSVLDIKTIRNILDDINVSRLSSDDLPVYQRLNQYINNPSVRDPSAMIKILRAAGIDDVPAEGSSIQDIIEHLRTKGVDFGSDIYQLGSKVAEKHRAGADARATEKIMNYYQPYFNDPKVVDFLSGFQDTSIESLVDANTVLVPDRVIQGTETEMRNLYGIDIDQAIRDNPDIRIQAKDRYTLLGSREVYQVTDVTYPEGKIGIMFKNIHSNTPRYLEFDTIEQANRFIGGHNIYNNIPIEEAKLQFAGMPFSHGSESADRFLRETYTGTLRSGRRINNIQDRVTRSILEVQEAPEFIRSDDFQNFIHNMQQGKLGIVEMQEMNERLLSEIAPSEDIDITKAYELGIIWSERDTLRAVAEGSPKGYVGKQFEHLNNIGYRSRIEGVAMPATFIETQRVKDIIGKVLPPTIPSDTTDDLIQQIVPSNQQYMELSRHVSGKETPVEALRENLTRRLKKTAELEQYGLGAGNIDNVIEGLNTELGNITDLDFQSGTMTSQFIRTGSNISKRNEIIVNEGMNLAADQSIKDSNLSPIGRVIRDVQRGRSNSLVNNISEEGVEWYAQNILPDVMKDLTSDEFDTLANGVRSAMYTGNNLSTAQDVIYKEAARRAGFNMAEIGSIAQPLMANNFEDAISRSALSLSKHGPAAAILGISMIAGGTIINNAFYDRMPSREMMGSDGYQTPDGMFVSTPPGYPKIASGIVEDRSDLGGVDIHINNVQNHTIASNIANRMKESYGGSIAKGSYKSVTDSDIKDILDRML